MHKGQLYDAEIEYLQSSGTQYIDTLIPASITLTAKLKFKNLQATGSVIFGADSTNDYDWRLFNYSNYPYMDVANGRLKGNYAWLQPNKIFELECGWQGQTGNPTVGRMFINNLNDSSYNISYNGSLSSNPISGTLCANGSVASKLSKNVWYYIQVYNNQTNILLFDGIPVRKGQVGYMYDRVSGNLLGNAGTGNFVLGPDKTGGGKCLIINTLCRSYKERRAA
jgi:hypothetical protein